VFDDPHLKSPVDRTGEIPAEPAEDATTAFRRHTG
jgi:hypothetical protein